MKKENFQLEEFLFLPFFVIVSDVKKIWANTDQRYLYVKGWVGPVLGHQDY